MRKFWRNYPYWIKGILALLILLVFISIVLGGYFEITKDSCSNDSLNLPCWAGPAVSIFFLIPFISWGAVLDFLNGTLLYAGFNPENPITEELLGLMMSVLSVIWIPLSIIGILLFWPIVGALLGIAYEKIKNRK